METDSKREDAKESNSYFELSNLEYKTNSAESFYSHNLLGFISRRRVDYLVSKLSSLNGKRVLDVGCEAGYVSFKLAEAGFSVYSLDVCKDAILDFKRKLDTKPSPLVVSPAVADAYHLPYRDSNFDAVVCSEVIPLLSSLKELFIEFARVLRKDGILVISFGNQKNRKLFFPILHAVGMNVEAIDKTFPCLHSPEDVASSKGENMLLEEVELFPFKYFNLNTIVVLRRK